MSSKSHSINPSVLSFTTFCDAMDVRPFLWQAPLTKTCTYIERGKRLAPHRCLVIDICLGNNGHICLRLDRRPTSRVALVSGKGSTCSHDEIMIADAILDLKLEQYELENMQVFPDSPPTLRDLVRILRAFTGKVKRYTLFSKNCWFLCSVVEELLPPDGRGLYVTGSRQNLHLGSHSRSQVVLSLASSQLSPGPISRSTTTSAAPSVYPFRDFDTIFTPPTLPTEGLLCSHRTPVEMYATSIALYLRDSVRLGSDELQRVAQVLKEQCELMLHKVHWDGGKDYADHMIARHLYRYGDHLSKSKSYQRAAEVLNQSVKMTRILHRRLPGVYSELLPWRLSILGSYYTKAILHDQTCMYQPKSLEFIRGLHEHKPANHKDVMAVLDSHYGGTRDIDPPSEKACQTSAKAILLGRQLALRNPRKYGAQLAKLLYLHGVSLHNRKLYKEACNAKAEAVSLTRDLYNQETVSHPAIRVLRLIRYGLPLHTYGTNQERYDAKMELVNQPHKFIQESTNILPPPLLIHRLHGYILSLYGCGQFDEACDASAELIALTRQIHHENPTWYGSKIAHLLHIFSVSFRNFSTYQTAFDAMAECITLARELCRQNPGRHTPYLAHYLQSYGEALHKSKRFREASEAKAESVALARQLENDHPGKYTVVLAFRIRHHASSLLKQGSYQAACDAGAESVAMIRELHRKDPSLHAHDLAVALSSYGVSLEMLRQHQSA